MKHTARRAIALLGTAVAATPLVALSPAQSLNLTPSSVTVAASDSTPGSGETFRLHGAVWSAGERVPAMIRVKTYRNGEWVNVKGAVMATNNDDRYTIRIVLKMKGERQLRVIGNPVEDGISTARKTITVTVN